MTSCSRRPQETLRELLKDERYLGAEAGMLASLHIWGRTLSFILMRNAADRWRVE